MTYRSRHIRRFPGRAADWLRRLPRKRKIIASATATALLAAGLGIGIGMTDDSGSSAPVAIGLHKPRPTHSKGGLPTTTASPSPSTTGGTVSPSPTQTTGKPGPLGIPGNWSLVFADDFDGTTLNTANWQANWLGSPSAITKPVNSAELSAYDPKQVTVEGGFLHLNAVQKPTLASNGVTYQYDSGLVESSGKRQFAYGAFEARMFLPGNAGQIFNWPAFWTDGQPPWPTNGENDIMEALGGGVACWHFHSPLGGPGACASGDYTGWHTFGANWQPGRVDYYYDGKPVGSITSGITGSPMFLVLNLGISTQHGGPLVVPDEVLVDYVRVWQ